MSEKDGWSDLDRSYHDVIVDALIQNPGTRDEQLAFAKSGLDELGREVIRKLRIPPAEPARDLDGFLDEVILFWGQMVTRRDALQLAWAMGNPDEVEDVYQTERIWDVHPTSYAEAYWRLRQLLEPAAPEPLSLFVEPEPTRASVMT